MKKYLFIMLIISFSQLSFIFAADTTSIKIDYSEEAQVYAECINDLIKTYENVYGGKIESVVLIDEYLREKNEDNSVIYLNDYTKFSGFYVKVFKNRKWIIPHEDTVKNFCEANSEVSNFSQRNPKIPIKQKYIFIPKRESVEERIKTSDFYNRYGNYLKATFSRIGFNKDKTQAFLYVEKSFPCWIGSGHFYIYEKNYEKWKIVSSFMVWII